MKKILQMRGPKKYLPQLDEGQLAFCTDTKETFIGSVNENVILANKYDLKSKGETKITSYNFGEPATELGTGAGTEVTRVINQPIGRDGLLRKVSLYAATAGELKIQFFSKNLDGTLNVERELVLTIEDTGANSLVDGVDFDGFYVKKDWYMGFYSESDEATLSYTMSGKKTYWATSNEVSGDNITFTTLPSSNKFDFAINITLDIVSIVDRKTNVLMKENFYSPIVPANVIIASGWTIDESGGLQSPTTGDWGRYFRFDLYSTMENVRAIARIVINDNTSVFSMIRRNTSHGTVAEIDCSNKRLRFYGAWDGTTSPPSVKSSKNFSMNIVNGREYIVSLERVSSMNRLILTDTVSKQSEILEYDNSDTVYSNYVGKQWGSPGVMFLSGDILVRSFEFISDNPRTVKNIILGDSIVEGYQYDQIDGAGNRWTEKVRNELGGNCVISGRGSGDSEDLLLRMQADVFPFNPEFVTVMIGANDVDYAAWEDNFNQIVQNIVDIGAEPILCTMISGANRTQINNYIRSLPYTVVNFDYDITAGLLLDGIHPTKLGHQKMFERYIFDAPQVFY